MVASNAHIANFCETQKQYKEVATKVNANPSVAQMATWKTVRERVKNLQETFDHNGNSKQNMSGIGEEIVEMEGLFMSMRDVRADILSHKSAKNILERELDRRKEKGKVHIDFFKYPLYYYSCCIHLLVQ